MIWTKITELRQCLESPQWPLSYDKWPTELVKTTNCLAFALGLNLPDKDYDSLVYTNPEIPIPKFECVFERLLTELNLEWRKISYVDDLLEDEYVIRIYGFYYMGRERHPDYHVIRRELDGTWVHKPDNKLLPCEINLCEFVEEYPNNEIAGTYAVRKKAR